MSAQVRAKAGQVEDPFSPLADDGDESKGRFRFPRSAKAALYLAGAGAEEPAAAWGKLPSAFEMAMLTRRFSNRPDVVPLLAIGSDAPIPRISIREGSTP